MPFFPANPDLFYRRNDPKDPRLGETVARWDGTGPLERALEGARAALIGWPDDRGVSANRGRPGAAEGPDAIRRAFYRLTPGIDGAFEGKKIVDLGNLRIEGDLETCHEKAAGLIEAVFKAGVPPVILGGGNDYAYADLLGLSRAEKPPIGLINIDAHFDVRDLSSGITSGTPFYRILEARPPIVDGANFVEFAIQPHRNSAEHYRYVRSKGGSVIFLDSLQIRGAQKVFFQSLARLKQDCPAVVVSFDMDGVRQASAPGVSAPSPNGLSAEDAEGIARLAGQEKAVKIFSIYEVSPPLDPDGRTSALAASMLWHFLHARFA